MPEPWHDLPLRLVTPGFLGRFDDDDPKEPSLFRSRSPACAASWPTGSARWPEHTSATTSAGFTTSKPLSSALRKPKQAAARHQSSSAPGQSTHRSRHLGESDGLRYLMGLASPPNRRRRRRSHRRATWRPARSTSESAHTVHPRSTIFSSPPCGPCALSAASVHAPAGDSAPSPSRSLPNCPTRRFDPLWLRRDNIDDLPEVLACSAAAIDDLGFATGLDRTAAFKDAPLYACFAAGSYRHSEDDQDQLPRNPGRMAGRSRQHRHLALGIPHGADRRVPESLPPRGSPSQTYDDVVQPFLDNPAPPEEHRKDPSPQPPSAYPSLTATTKDDPAKTASPATPGHRRSTDRKPIRPPGLTPLAPGPARRNRLEAAITSLLQPMAPIRARRHPANQN